MQFTKQHAQIIAVKKFYMSKTGERLIVRMKEYSGEKSHHS